MKTGLLGALMVLGAAGAAQGFELLRVNHDPCARSDQNLFWNNAAVAVSVSPLEDPYNRLATDAWERWNMSLQRFRFRSGSGQPCTRDGVATVAIVDEPCGLADFGDALAITRSVWNQNGTLVDADISFQDDTFVVDSVDDNPDVFRQVAMHELGHVLGLDHSDACGGSGVGTLMRAVLTPPLLQAPQADDVSGADSIYPANHDGGDGTVPSGANSCAVGHPAGGAGAAWLLVALAPLLFWRRMRRGN